MIYTPWSNLMKNASMSTGQVSFHDPKLTKKILVSARQNSIVNRLNKTKTERFPDLRNEKEKDHAYDDLMDEDEVAASSNQDRDPDFLDDFM